MTTEGIEFINAKPEQVIEHLEKRQVRQLEVSPSSLLVKNGGKRLRLKDTRTGEEYPLRKSFLYKLLKWNYFPLQQLQYLSCESVAGICNDYLLQMNSGPVLIKLEEDEALTITSCRYAEIADLDIINILEGMKIKSVSRNDFMLQVLSEEKHKIEPVPGDIFGAGVTVINSETGFRALRVSHFILRYSCSNGASVKINKSQSRCIHYGQSSDNLKNFIKEQVKTAETARQELFYSLERISEKRICDEKAAVMKIQTALGKDKFRIKEDMPLYAFFNQVTETAKKYDLSRRSYIEQLAGNLLI